MLRVHAVLAHYRPDHTTPFCWLAKLARRGVDVTLFYNPLWQRVECAGSYYYPLKVVNVFTKQEGVAPDWIVFLLTSFFDDEKLVELVVSNPSPRRGAVFLCADNQSMMWESKIRQAYNLSPEKVYTYRLWETPYAPFTFPPPEATCPSRHKVRNSVLVSFAGGYGGAAESEVLLSLCNILASEFWYPRILDYREDEKFPASTPPLPSPLGFFSFVSTFQYWVLASPPNMTLGLSDSGYFELWAAKCGGVVILTNLKIPPPILNLPYLVSIVGIKREIILSHLWRGESIAPPAQQEMENEVRLGWKAITSLLGLEGGN